MDRESETLGAREGNLLVGALTDGTPCALVSWDDLEAADQRLRERLGRDTNPGELLGAVARELRVSRVIAVHCPPDQRLESLLVWSGPGQILAQPGASEDMVKDLSELTVVGPKPDGLQL